MLHYNLTRTLGTLYKELCTFVIIFRSVLLRMGNVSDRICRGKRNMYLFWVNDQLDAQLRYIIRLLL